MGNKNFEKPKIENIIYSGQYMAILGPRNFNSPWNTKQEITVVIINFILEIVSYYKKIKA